MASDVYGLGAVLYHLLTDVAPFSGPTPLAILRQAETVEPKDPRALKPTLDRDLVTICLKCLEKTPGKRYRSAAALADDLERWQRGEPVVARPATWTERLWKWTKRHPAKAALYFTASIGTAVLAVVLAVGNVLLREEKEYAQAKEADARRGTARAEASEEAMRQNVYAADLFLARRALEDGHLGVAREMLTRHQPAEGVKDLRGYEWYALERQCQGDDVRALTGHAAPVLAVAWSPDGKRVATGGGDGSLKIWQANDASLEKDLPDQPKLSKLGELGLLATLPLRSPEAAELLAPGSGVSVDEIRMRARPSSLGEVRVLAWSPDGGMLATAGLGSYVRIWKTTDWSFQGFLPTKTCTQLAFTKEGQLIVALSGSVATKGIPEVRMYDVATLQRQQTWTDVVPCFALAQNVGWLAVAKKDGVVEVVELATSSVKHTLKLNEGITRLAIAANGERLAALHGHTGTLWQVVEHRLVAGFGSAGEVFQCLAMTANGDKFAASGAGHIIQLFSGRDGASLWSMRGHDDELLSLEFSPDSRLLATGSNDHTARLWSAEKPHHQVLEIAEGGKLVASDVSGNALLAERDGAVRCWDAQGKLLGATPSDASRVALAFDPQNGNFATLQEKSGTLEWWNKDGSQAGEAVKLPVVDGGFHEECAARGWIAISGARGPVQLFDWHQGKLLREFPAPSFKMSRMLVSPDGRWIVAVQWPRTLALLDTETGKWNEQHKLAVGTVGPIVFSPDGRFLATSGSDNLVSVWDPLTWKLLAALRGHKTEVKALGFTVDGRTLASSSSDGTVHLWHTPTWRELGVLHRGPLCSGLLFTPRELWRRNM